MPDPTDSLLDQLLVDARRVLDTIDPALADLCHDRIAPLVGLAGAPTRRPTTPLQHACIDLVEQMVLDVPGVTDAQVAGVAQHLGDDGAATFVHAALVIEQRLRMRALWERLGLRLPT